MKDGRQGFKQYLIEKLQESFLVAEYIEALNSAGSPPSAEDIEKMFDVSRELIAELKANPN